MPAHADSRPPRPTGYTRLVSAAVAVVLLILMVIAELWLFSIPTRVRAQQPISYQQSVSLTYDATVPASSLYPSGHIATGQVIDPARLPQLPIAVSYRFSSTASAVVHGTIGLSGSVYVNGELVAPLSLATQRPFTFPSTTVTATLPIATIQSEAAAVAGMTSTSSIPGLQIQISPVVAGQGTLDGIAFNPTFSPHITLSQSGVGVAPLVVNTPGTPHVSASQQLNPTSDGAVTRTVSSPRRINLWVGHVGVGSLKIIVGLAAVLLFAVAAWLLLPFARDPVLVRRALEAAPARGYVQVNVDPQTLSGMQVVGVQNLAALLAVARKYDAVVMHAYVDGGETFSVWDHGLLYQYATSNRRPRDRVT